MNYQLLIAYILSVSIFIITPGPVLALVLKNATGGLNKALLTIIGTNLASLILISIAIAMIYGIIAIAENILAQLAFCGSIFILYLGISGLIADIKNQQSNTRFFDNKKDKRAYFLQGFGIAISNPKDIIFFIAFFPQFIAITNNAQLSIIFLTIIWILFDFSLLLLYAMLMNKSCILRFKKPISVVSDIVLMIIGLAGITIYLKNTL